MDLIGRSRGRVIVIDKLIFKLHSNAETNEQFFVSSHDIEERSGAMISAWETSLEYDEIMDIMNNIRFSIASTAGIVQKLRLVLIAIQFPIV